MRVSEWRSDVCSSDLRSELSLAAPGDGREGLGEIADLRHPARIDRCAGAVIDVHRAQLEMGPAGLEAADERGAGELQHRVLAARRQHQLAGQDRKSVV